MAEPKKPFYRQKKWKLGNSMGWWNIPYCPHCKRQLGLMADVIRLGTPQRRRRISVVADFGGESAAQIQFERESVSGHPAESGAAGEGFAETSESGFNPAVARSLTARADGSPCADRGPNIVCSPHPRGVTAEKSGTLGAGNDQTIFCMATQQGGAELRRDDRAPTLTAAAGMSGNNQPVVAIPINDKATRWQGGGESRNHDGSGNGLGIGKEGDPSPTLTAGDRHGVAVALCAQPGMKQQTFIAAGFKLGNSEQARSIGYQEELSPTLNAECGGNKPAVVALDMTHACDVIRECGEQAPSLQARIGTGGNQVPLTYQDVTGTLSPGAHAGSYNGQDAYNDMLVVSSEISPSLRAKGNDPYRADMSAYVASVDCRNFREGGEVNGMLQAKESGGQSLNLNNTVRQNMVVRRLTPMECERLQGFPDHWTDIGEWTAEKGKKHKDADSPRYKALGNSIALPFWDWMLRRMARYLPDGATLGSLFDGIGGFPLIWERIHSKGTARWASEIEPFPIAVTKKRFGEE